MPSSSTALATLTSLLQQGLLATPPEGAARYALENFLDERYGKLQHRKATIRDAYGRSAEPTHIPFAGVLPEASPPSGAYGGMSVVWFPRPSGDGGGSLLTFVVGTLGLSPDEGIIGRPGHRRYVQAMRAHLHRLGVRAWAKPDPANIQGLVPASVRQTFPNWDSVWDRYGPFIYAAAELLPNMRPALASTAVTAFFDLHARERGWRALAEYAPAFGAYLEGLADVFFRNPDEDEVLALLAERRFVVLQGPPGTGKTRMADRIRTSDMFQDRALAVQFHPAVTYEDFVIGLAPRPESATLGFQVRAGWLLQAVQGAEQAGHKPFLLAIDEINRGDLGKVLGEAIYLLEPGEDREITLPHPWDGRKGLRLPANLHILATMNTADRSIAGLDLAVRRRFAYVTLHPDRAPIVACGQELAIEAFGRLAAVFLQHCSDDALALLPGQAYFLAQDEAQLRRRFRHELLPLLDEYLGAGLLGPAAPEVQTLRDWLADQVGR